MKSIETQFGIVDDFRTRFTGLLNRVIGNKFTVIARKEDKIVGLMISKVMTLTQYNTRDAGRNLRISQILENLTEQASERLPEEFVHLHILTVSSDCQKMGIGGRLVDRVIDRAREESVGALLTEATGLYSQKIFESRGFRAISEIEYCENKDEEGVRVFQHTHPHPSLKLMVLNIDA